MTRQVISFQRGTVASPSLRRCLGRFATGVTVITTRTEAGKREGMTANSFAAVSLDPPLVLWNIKRDAASIEAFLDSGMCAINVLTQEQADLSHRFATPQPDKFGGLGATEGLGGCPLLPDTLTHFECRLDQKVEAGDHLVLIWRILRAGYDDAAAPLLFSAGRYAVAAPLPNRDATNDIEAMWGGLGTAP